MFAYGLGSSGIFGSWAANDDRAGVNLLPDLSAAIMQRIAAQVEETKRPGDIAVASIHWGGNRIEAKLVAFRREQKDKGQVACFIIPLCVSLTSIPYFFPIQR